MLDWTEFRKVSLWVTLVAAIIAFLAWRFPVGQVNQGTTQPPAVAIKLEPSPQNFPATPTTSISAGRETSTAADSPEESRQHVWMVWDAPWTKSNR